MRDLFDIIARDLSNNRRYSNHVQQPLNKAEDSASSIVNDRITNYQLCFECNHYVEADRT